MTSYINQESIHLVDKPVPSVLFNLKKNHLENLTARMTNQPGNSTTKKTSTTSHQSNSDILFTTNTQSLERTENGDTWKECFTTLDNLAKLQNHDIKPTTTTPTTTPDPTYLRQSLQWRGKSDKKQWIPTFYLKHF